MTEIFKNYNKILGDIHETTSQQIKADLVEAFSRGYEHGFADGLGAKLAKKFDVHDATMGMST